ncbi:response regulator transcription factor [filamentous cyanobacterium LEGE 11480]|uniref:Response regulator transcription factor n=1 Tax=Romeriopsis navalis LEGE 11480 TaxID=2777977 RepID=A0A928VM57_9CYAN|nr:response regulator transcription factor [Romeriopsis navalis]MBE9028912.1 response regulator transcription factor [Romeriopsis navalis LEGE 11480]
MSVPAVVDSKPPPVNQNKKILLVEDEKNIADAIALALSTENYEVTIINNGRDAIQALVPDYVQGTKPEVDYDLLILDLMLPFVNGLDICRQIRGSGNIIPILILSAKASETDRVVGLEVGADDYLTKPFGMRELVARCRALLRRPQGPPLQPEETILRFRALKVYIQEHRVLMGNQEINLPPKEFRLLEVFIRSPKQVFSREQLLHRVWGVEYTSETKTVDVHVRWLREKLERDPSHPKYIITVRGFGYRLG